ncbi:MAG: tetratricopeptide repeat protein [Gammaproteobacteria bacterium]|nr:tetratricopeptide repeat protein [Gammaproteobacteria bacterium]MCH9743368.1 tetratricopeptide repeat protein [Gammaproteobacteria bacterium]
MPDSDRLKQAELLHQQGRLSEALQLYHEILEDDPNQADTAHIIAILHAQKQEYDKALQFTNVAIELQPRNATFHNTLGNIYAAQQNQEQSISAYEKAIELNPRYAIAYNNLANRLYHQGKHDAAEKAYQKALEIDSQYIDAHYNLALLYANQNKHAEAIKHFRTILKLQPQHYPSLYNLGQLSLISQDYKNAIECFDQCSKQNPEDVELHHQLGLALYQDKQYEGAIHYLKKTLMLEPKHKEANHHLGNALLKSGDTETALNYFFKQLEIDPFFESYYNIGVLLTYQERQRDAAQYLQQALAIKPDDLDTHLNLGNLYLKLLNYDKAILHYQAAQKIKPDDAEISHILHAISQSKNPTSAPGEYTSHLFNQYAPHYDQHLCKFLHYDVPQQLQQAVFEEIGEQQQLTILDLGCGTGLCGELFAPQAKELIGIDIAADMITIAENKKIYHQLQVSDINSAISQFHDIDLILAADVFTYIGDLSNIFVNANNSLKKGGLFAFSVEKGSGQDFKLQQTIRYAHSQHYIEQLSNENQFNLLRCDNIILRKQKGKPVEGYLVILQK